MSTELEQEVDRLRAAIRKHMNERGDNRCHISDHELYLVLPEGDTRPAREVAVTLDNCRRYIECRQQGREYVSPQDRIDELETALRTLSSHLLYLSCPTSVELPALDWAGNQVQPEDSHALALSFYQDMQKALVRLRDEIYEQHTYCRSALDGQTDKDQDPGSGAAVDGDLCG